MMTTMTMMTTTSKQPRRTRGKGRPIKGWDKIIKGPQTVQKVYKQPITGNTG